MKRLILSALMLCTMTVCMGQTFYSARRETHAVTDSGEQKHDSVATVTHMKLASRYLQTSAAFDYVALGTATISALFYTGVLGGDDSERRNVCGTIFAALAVGSRVAAIHLKHKSGIELRLSATSVAVSF